MIIFTATLGLAPGALCLRLLRRLLHDFELEIQFLATKDCRQIKLPELSREAEGGPTLIEINQKLHAQRAPEIRETNVRGQRFQLSGRVERKRCA